MNTDHIDNLKVLAAVNHNSVSEQNLKLLGVKYNLSDMEMHELDQYCKDSGITIYDEEKEACVSDDVNDDCYIKKTDTMAKEEKENKKQVSSITKRIMHMAEIKARERVKGRGWLCGTYTSSVRRSVEQQVRSRFTNEELKYIIDHLNDSDEEVLFTMGDPQSPEMCDILNDKLNELIPRLHINRSYMKLLDD